eukprot:294317-Lingulodinium_polyedra.AAC.1
MRAQEARIRAAEQDATVAAARARGYDLRVSGGRPDGPLWPRRRGGSATVRHRPLLEQATGAVEGRV